jgi:hypothetical protein
MKSRVNSLIIFLLLTCFVKAQTPELEWVAKNTRPDGDTYIEKLISLDNNGYLALRGKETVSAQAYIRLSLQRYDNNFKAGAVKLIPYRLSTDITINLGKIPTIILLDKFGEEVYLFTANINKDNGTASLMAKRIDPETLDIDEEGIKLVDAELPDKAGWPAFKNIHLSKSSDGKNLLVLVDYPGSKDEQKKYKINVFNNKLELIWQKDMTFDYKNENLYLNSCNIDNNGNVVASAVLYNDNKPLPSKGKISSEFLLFYFKSDNSNVVETKLSIAGISLARLEQTFDQKGNLVCGGFYTSPSMSVFKGVFIIITDPAKGTILNSSYKTFGPEYSRTMISDEVKKLNLVFPNALDDYGYEIRELKVLSNGTIKMITEQRIYVSYNANNSFNVYNFRSFENILCVSADISGKIQWIARIPKKQDDYPLDTYYYSSYQSRISDGTLQFFYNDNIENLNSSKSLYFEYNSKFVTVMTTVDENGNVKTDELWDPKVDKVMIVPKSFFFVSDKEILFEAKKAKSEYFAKISFK